MSSKPRPLSGFGITKELSERGASSFRSLYSSEIENTPQDKPIWFDPEDVKKREKEKARSEADPTVMRPTGEEEEPICTIMDALMSKDGVSWVTWALLLTTLNLIQGFESVQSGSITSRVGLIPYASTLSPKSASTSPALESFLKGRRIEYVHLESYESAVVSEGNQIGSGVVIIFILKE